MKRGDYSASHPKPIITSDFGSLGSQTTTGFDPPTKRNSVDGGQLCLRFVQASERSGVLIAGQLLQPSRKTSRSALWVMSVKSVLLTEFLKKWHAVWSEQ
jgi:hypothetical protein